MPSVMDLVQRSHSANTSTSPVPSSSTAFSSSGLPLVVLPEAFSRKSTSTRSARRQPWPAPLTYRRWWLIGAAPRMRLAAGVAIRRRGSALHFLHQHPAGRPLSVPAFGSLRADRPGFRSRESLWLRPWLSHARQLGRHHAHYGGKRSVTLDETTASRRTQPRAQGLGHFASFRRDPDAMPNRRVAHDRAHEEWLTAAEDRLIFPLQLRVLGKRVALQTIADELHRPGGTWRRRRARGRRRALYRELRRFDTWRGAGNADLPRPCVRPLPLLGGVTGHAANVSGCLRWQRATS